MGDDIEIVVLGMKKGQVRLGINAPRNLSIHREEIYQRILEENRLAAMSTLEDRKKLDEIYKG